MKGLKPLLKIISGLVDIRVKYEEIKSNEESKVVSTVLGKKALGYDFWFAVCTAIAVGLGYWGAAYINTIAIFFGIVLIVLAIGFGFYSLVFLLFALSASIKQLKLNRKPIGIFALILTLAFIAAIVVIAVAVVNKINN